MTLEKFLEKTLQEFVNHESLIIKAFNDECIELDRFTQEIINEFVKPIDEINEYVHNCSKRYAETIYNSNHDLHEDERVEGCEQCKIERMTEEERYNYFDNRPETLNELYLLKGA